MRKFLIAAGVVPLLACSAEDLERMQARAAPITEISHVVTTRLHRGAVVLTVKRQLRNDGPTWEQVTHTINVPAEAVVTSLRVGSEGVLLDADEATSRWYELISPGDADPTTSAMLEWMYRNELQLKLFGFAPGATLDLEYDLQLPPVYEDGGWTFDYPYEDGGEWSVVDPTFDLWRIPGAAVESGKVRMPRAPIDRTDAKWALFQVGPDRTMWRFELDAAKVLEPAPVRPNVVFVIDASHSQTAEGINAQLEVLAPYLANVPDAQVEVVLYRRFAERLFGRFIPASDVVRMIATTPKKRLAPGNGSNLELGARLAAEALSQVSGVGRIVLFTDAQLRDEFTNGLAIAEFARAPRDTVVHLVARDGYGGSELNESRDDDNALAPIAAASGGVFFGIGGSPIDPVAAAATMLGLVRPIRIDGFAIEAKGLDGDRLDAPGTLEEGTTLRYTALAARPPSEVTVTGKIWSREYRKVVTIDSDLSTWMPGLAIGVDEVESRLSDDEVRVAALSARAVSRVTSFLAAKPTTGASTIGKLHGGTVMSRSGACDCRGGGSHSSGCGGFRFANVVPDYERLLRALFAPGVAACASQHRVEVSGFVTVEATGDEIVAATTAGSSPEFAACVDEVVWASRLTGEFTSHQTYEVDFAQ